MTHPNIVFIVADDLGYADLSCYGQTDYATPQLDQLAVDGMRFRQAYANSALCTNTRVALITGRYQYRFDLGLVEPLRPAHSGRGLGLPEDHPTLPSLLKTQGYDTALIGKWHLGILPKFGPQKSGYDTFYGVMGGYTGYYTRIGDTGATDFYDGEQIVDIPGYTTDILSQRAVDYIKDRKAESPPFFLSLHYTAPHLPWSSPFNEQAARIREAGPSSKIMDGGSPRIYAEMVQIMDSGIGRVTRALHDAGIRDNTLVVFTSDNGGERYSKNWPFVGRKVDLLEGGIRVPQIVSWPGRVREGVTDQVTIGMDLTATCLSCAGVEPSHSHPLDGKDLMPFLDGGMPIGDRTLFWRMRDRYQRAVRRGDWKYLKVADQEFLFDLSFDWRERANFNEERPDLLSELREMWLQWNEEMLPLPETEVPRLAKLNEMLW